MKKSYILIVLIVLVIVATYSWQRYKTTNAKCVSIIEASDRYFSVYLSNLEEFKNNPSFEKSNTLTWMVLAYTNKLKLIDDKELFINPKNKKIIVSLKNIYVELARFSSDLEYYINDKSYKTLIDFYINSIKDMQLILIKNSRQSNRAMNSNKTEIVQSLEKTLTKMLDKKNQFYKIKAEELKKKYQQFQ